MAITWLAPNLWMWLVLFEEVICEWHCSIPIPLDETMSAGGECESTNRGR